MYAKFHHFIFATAFLAFGFDVSAAPPADWPQYGANPFVIELEIPGPENNDDSAGGIVVYDLDGDGLLDYLVTDHGHVAAYAHDGAKLWVNQCDVGVGWASENQGLPGHHGPGVQAGDVDGDGDVEVLYLTKDNTLHAVSGATGAELWTAKPPAPPEAERWEHLIIGNFRGRGDRDLLLQATNAKGYRTGRFLAAFAIEDLQAGKFEPLWRRDDFVSCAHNGARLADLDLDGRDETLGATVIGPEGEMLFRFDVKGHLDSIYAVDARPDLPGLEVLGLEEGGNRVFLFNAQRMIWTADHKRQEPQNGAVGEFDRDNPGLEIWCRSRYPQHQKPFVFNARGELIAEYEMDDVAPKGWTIEGVEVINTIDWTGRARQLAAAKARHESGDVCVFDPISGAFVEQFREQADRLYVADVSGDWREELIVLHGNELRIYHNAEPNPRPHRPRLWEQAHYRRAKMTWNYYSP